MANICMNIDAGGIFSKFMFYVMNSVGLDNDSVYLNCTDGRALGNGNPFDFVLDQHLEENYVTTQALHLGNYTNVNKIENSQYLLEYRKSVRRVEFSKDLKSIIDENIHLILPHTIGIHIRLTDMNRIHPEYGAHTIEDYINVMNSFGPGAQFFIASDNNQSLEILLEKFEDRISFVPGLIRGKTEKDALDELQADNFSNKNFWIQAFLDMYLLSRCSTLVFKTSNLSNVAILFAEDGQKLVRI